MIRLLAILLTGICCSLYLFPFKLTFFPIGNTKIFLAICGLAIYFFTHTRDNKPVASRAMVTVSFAAVAVSFISFISLIYNGTNDTTYAKYIIQMWVWAGGAYFVTQCMKAVHGKVSIEIIGFYVIGVCVVQCLLALFIEFIPLFKEFVDTYVEQDTANLNRLDRMYGIGASLDTAGSRFACALILLLFILIKYVNENRSDRLIYLLAFLFVFIFIVGNMVARTTSIGGVICFFYLLYCLKNGNGRLYQKVFLSFATILTISIPILTILYNSSPEIRDMFRFAFEGFFNWSEKGIFETGSTNDLLAMWGHIPQYLKTWIIGDGYFMNPSEFDNYYIGKHQTWGFYMETDVGYLRFIFYFGLVGLLTFAYFFVLCTRKCLQIYTKDKELFVLLLLLNYILWCKVATDVFFIYALFLVADYSEASEMNNPALEQ